MFRLNLKIALRNLIKNKFSALINIIGFSIGITAMIFVSNYTYFHRSFDNMYKDADNTYRINTEIYVDDVYCNTHGATMQFVGPAIKEDFPEIEDAVRFFPLLNIMAFKEDNSYLELEMFATDSTCLDFFDIDLIVGDKNTALSKPYSIVITEEIAKIFFGDENPIGKSIGMGITNEYKSMYEVKGVMKNRPANTHLYFDVLVSGVDPGASMLEFTPFNGGPSTYHYASFSTYVKIKDDTDPEYLESKFPQFLDNRIKKIMDEYGLRKIFLQPLKEIHLGTKYDYSIGTYQCVRNNEFNYVYIKWITYFALVLLIFAILNFVNLSLVNVVTRNREMGLRRTFGANMFQFFKQFLMEASVLTLLSFVIAIIFIAIFKSYYYNYVELPTSFSIFNNYLSYLFMLLLFCGVVLLNGFFLFVTVAAIKVLFTNKDITTNNKKSTISFRKSLIIFQFILTYTILCGALFFNKQIDFMLSKDLGYNKENIFSVKKYSYASGFQKLSLDNYKALKQDLKTNPKILDVALSSVIPGNYHHSSQRCWINDQQQVLSNSLYIDNGYIDVFKLKLLAGRNFDEGENDAVLINKSLMKKLGVENPDEIVGKHLSIDDIASHHLTPGEYRIIGVLDDFYQEPLNKSITPAKFHYVDQARGVISVKTQGVGVLGINNEIINTVKKYFPQDELRETYYLTDFYASQYKQDFQFQKLILLNSVLCLIIAMLGIFGLFTFTINRSQKVIAIRKVLGANSFNIISLYTKEYLRLILGALVLSVLIAYLFVKQILNFYTFRIEINASYFIAVAFFLTLIILLLISIKVYKSSKENPVNALRNE